MPGHVDLGVAEALARYVPAWVCRRLSEQGPLAGEVEVMPFRASVLLADLSGFTAITERALLEEDRGAERVQEALNTFFGRIADLVLASHGEILAYPGDAVLCMWPANPDTEEVECVRRAAACAAAIIEQVHGLRIDDDLVLRVRVSVAAGPVWRAIAGGVSGHWEALVGGAALSDLGPALERARPGQGMLAPLAARALGLPDGSAIPQGPASEPEPPPSPMPPMASAEDLKGFVPETVVARITAGLGDWLAEFRRVSVMFVRLVDLPDPVRDAAPLQAITRAMQAAVFEQGGAVTQFVVDEKGPVLVAGWGIAHHVHELDAGRAILAGKRIEESLLGMGMNGAIGIATGRVWTGLRGNPSRSEFAMIGDVVNLAARLMQASDTTTLCDQETSRDCARLWRFEQLGTIPLKGREPAAVFRPIAPSSATPAQAQRRTFELLGREREFMVVDDALQALARRGEGGVLTVVGDAGTGKSHLLAKSIERASAMGLNVIVVHGQPVTDAAPFSDVRNYLRHAAGLDTLTDDSARAARIRDLMADPDIEPILPILLDALGMDAADTETTRSMGAKGRASAALSLVSRLFETITGGTPTLLVMEDAHWLNSSIWTLAVELRRRMARLQIMIGTRPWQDNELIDSLCAADGAARIDLEPLDAEAIAGLIAQRLGVLHVAEDIVRLVHDKSEGNPFYAEELAYALRDRGVVELRRHECVLTGPLEALTLPSTVEDVVASRVDLLDAPQQLSVKVASVLGRTFDLASLQHLHPIPTDQAPLVAQLDGMVRLQLLAPGTNAGDYEFKHAITHQVVYGLLPYAQRRILHGRAAEWLEEQALESGHVPFAHLAHHYGLAGARERAIHNLEQAADQAFSDFANAEAARFYGELIDFEARTRTDGPEPVVRRAVWHRKKGEAHSNLGQLDRSVPELQAALTLLRRRPPNSNLGWMVRAVQELALRAGRGFVPGTRQAARVDPRNLELVRSHSLLGANFYVLDRAVPFIGALLSAAGASDRIGATRETALAYANLGNVAGIIPVHRMAHRFAMRAIATAAEVDDPGMTARVQIRTGIYLGCAGIWRVEEIDAAMKTSERIGDRHMWEEGASVLLAHHYYRGELDRCEALSRDLTRSALRSGALLHILWGLLGQAMVAQHRGEVNAAVEYAKAALEHMESKGTHDRDSSIRAYGTLAAAQYRQGFLGPAFATAEVAVDLVERFGRAGYSFFPAAAAVADMYLSAVEDGRSIPDAARAEARLNTLLRQLQKLSRRFLVAEPRTLVLRARAMRLRGDAKGAVHALERAQTMAERYGMRLDLALANMEWARTPMGSGEQRAAALASAIDIFDAIGARDERARAASIEVELA